MSNNVTPLEPRQPTMTSGGRIAAIVPQSMEEAYRLAKAVCMAGMAPKGLDTPEKAMVAILHGMEIGLPPMMALQRIAVVNGRPTLFGDGALALVRASGLCEYVKETVEGEGDKRVAVCETKRKGERDPVKRAFSVADAKKAGLWGKAGPWTQFSDRMLSMRARAFCLRDVYPDATGGLYFKEEMEGVENGTHRYAPTPPAPPPVPQASIAPPLPRAAPAPSQAQQSTPGDIDFDGLRAALKSATTLDEANAVFDGWIIPREKHMNQDEQDEAQNILRECAAPLWSGDE